MKFRFEDLHTDIMNTTGRYMARCWPNLPPLVWCLDSDGILTGKSETDSRTEVDAWAAALALTVAPCHPGAYEVSGVVNATPIVVWAIVDREAWESDDDETVPEDPDAARDRAIADAGGAL